MTQYMGWDLLDTLPDGWKIDRSAGSPVCGYEFCTNGKSVFNGQQRALFFVGKTITEQPKSKPFEVQEEKPQVVVDQLYVRTLNELARKTFEQKMLNDIMVDLMICEIEGWGKLEYIKHLRKSIAGLLRRTNEVNPNQLSLLSYGVNNAKL